MGSRRISLSSLIGAVALASLFVATASACDDPEIGNVPLSFDASVSLTFPDGGGVTPPADGGSAEDSGDGGAAGDTDGGATVDAGDGGAPIVVEGNAWGFMTCQYSDGNGNPIGSPCITYTIGHCADESAYGAKCAAGNPPIPGPPECSQDKRSTTYRCHHDWCARGCVPGGGAPDWNWIPIFSCTTQAGCGP